MNSKCVTINIFHWILLTRMKMKRVLGYGHFNTIHAGHIRYLRYAKSLGDSLHLALRGDDGANQYDFNQSERLEGLKLLGLADEIICLEADELEYAISTVKPDILLLGSEFKEGEWIDEIRLITEPNDVEVVFHSGSLDQVSEGLLGSNERIVNVTRREQLISAIKRQGISLKEMNHSINEWKNARIVVVGDTILDQFSACEALGLSAEAPVVVVKEMKCEDFIGGSAIVAAHIQSLGCKCDFVSVVGQDDEAEAVKSQLKEWDVSTHLIRDHSSQLLLRKDMLLVIRRCFALVAWRIVI